MCLGGVNSWKLFFLQREKNAILSLHDYEFATDFGAVKFTRADNQSK